MKRPSINSFNVGNGSLQALRSAGQAIVPYIGDMMNPDISLVMGNNRRDTKKMMEVSGSGKVGQIVRS